MTKQGIGNYWLQVTLSHVATCNYDSCDFCVKYRKARLTWEDREKEKSRVFV